MNMMLRLALLITLGLSCGANVATAQQLEVKPALWQVEHQGTVSYLFGSIHIGKKSWYPLPVAITDAFERSRSLVVELNTLTHGGDVQQAMALPQGSSLQQLLRADTYTKLTAYAASFGVPLATFDSLKPWAAATVAAILPYMKQGLLPQYGIDMYFINSASASNKPILELETVAFQLGMLEQVFKDEAAFVEVLEMPQGAVTEMVDYWLAGNMTELDRLTVEQMTPQQLALILTERNQDWVTKISKMLTSQHSHFVVVGAAHLAGEQGVPALLAARGMKVKRVILP